MEVIKQAGVPTYLSSAQIADINAEMHRQELLRLTGVFERSCYTGDGDHNYRIVGEEFGEVARALNEADRENLEDEILQTATCCLQWRAGLIDTTACLRGMPLSLSRETAVGLRKYHAKSEYGMTVANRKAFVYDMLFAYNQEEAPLTPEEMVRVHDNAERLYQILPEMPEESKSGYRFTPWFVSGKSVCLGVRHRDGKTVHVLELPTHLFVKATQSEAAPIVTRALEKLLA